MDKYLIRMLIGTVVVGMVSLMVACSTMNRGPAPLPERDASAFMVTALEGQGSYAPALDVAWEAEGASVTVMATGAEALESAFFEVSFDGASYHPLAAEIGDFLGGDGQVLSLAVTDLADVVAVGIVQIAGSEAEAASGAGVLARLRFAPGPTPVSRTVSASPKGTYNAVTDLQIVEQAGDGSTATLRWTEKNVGDYNNDSEVGVADLTPLGIYYEQEVATHPDPLRIGLADGNNDGRITVADITQIGANFGSRLNGYILYMDAAGEDPYGSGITANRTDFDDDLTEPVVYTFVADLPGGSVDFTVRPVASDDLAHPGPVSEPATIIDVPGPPEDPSDVLATSTSGTGHQTVLLTWTESPSADVAGYEVERKLSADSSWDEAVAVGNVTTYTDHDTSLLEQDYDYRVRARDFTNLYSGYVQAAPITPYFAEPPGAPQNPVADNNIMVDKGIEVRWDPPVDDSMVNAYRVYRRMTPDETEFSLLNSTNKYTTFYQDTGLTPDVYYEYYVTAVSTEDAESDPSDIVGNTPSEYAASIVINSLTTDKTTHYYLGDPGMPSHITVSTTPAATSYVWESSAAASPVQGTGASVTWEPEPGTPVEPVTITCTAYNGEASDQESLTLYMTYETIKSTLGDNGRYIDFTAECLEPLELGGSVIPGRSFSYFIDGEHVVLMDRWESS